MESNQENQSENVAVNHLNWSNFSLCSTFDPETFFPEKGGSTKEAKKICGECVVISYCRDYALEKDIRFGIWGGLAESERQQIKIQRKRRS